MRFFRHPHYLTLLITLIIEAVLLLVICMIMLLGVVGIFLPILPGILLIAIGVGMYTLLLHDRRSQITRRVHFLLVPVLRWIPQPWVTRLSTAPRRSARASRAVAHYGAALAGLDVAIAIGLVFAGIFILRLSSLTALSLFWTIFALVLTFFVFAEAAVIAWFRFGRLLGRELGYRPIGNAAVVVLVSALPWLILLVLVSGILQVIGVATIGIGLLVTLVLMFITTFAAVFKLGIVLLGVVTVPQR